MSWIVSVQLVLTDGRIFDTKKRKYANGLGIMAAEVRGCSNSYASKVSIAVRVESGKRGHRRKQR